MTAGNPVTMTPPDAYTTPTAVNESTTPGLFETTIVTSEQQLDIGNGQLANLEVYNGTAPGPTLFLNQNDDVVVRMINQLPHPSGIHWHGIELPIGADGTPVTQNGLAAATAQTLGDGTPAGGTYLYKFRVPRPGLFWYHPHHYHTTNRVFRQTVGMIVVAHPDEATLISTGVLPDAAHTFQLMLTDTTVCKMPGSNDAQTYDTTTLPWAGPGGVLPNQSGPTPATLCELAPVDEHGMPRLDPMNAFIPFQQFDIPNIHQDGTVNEGQTVLTNGVNVGHRPGTPETPGAVAAGGQKLAITPGEGVRLQIVNAATSRYFRLHLKVAVQNGALTEVISVPLIRVGGEGGLLDFARVEGDPVGTPGFNKFEEGEIVLPPASRADVVAVIPANAVGEATLWTLDYQRTGSGAAGNWANIPTVPVMHFDISGAPGSYSLSPTAPILDAVGSAVPVLPAPAPTAGYLPVPAGKAGMSDLTIKLESGGGIARIDGVSGGFAMPPIYTQVPHLGSTRYGASGEIIMLTVRNDTNAHHPFHLHGFSFQPVALTHPSDPDFNFTYNEFRDTVDVPPGYTLTAKVHFEERFWYDGTTPGGNFGRWLFHCHIFHHAHKGMIAELVVTTPDGTEKPDVSVNGSWAYAPIPGIARRTGKVSHPDGLPIPTLEARRSDGSLIGTITTSGDTWEWEYDTTGATAFTDYIYVTASDGARNSQAVFRLQAGGDATTAWDNGDPHIHTLDGQRYDFQAAGEFVLLTDDHGLEVQARQTPVPTQNPINDSYTGLRLCVAVNTAIAARVGGSWISYQPGEQDGALQFYLNGKPADLSERGITLKGHRISTFDADGETGLRIDWAHGPVLQITPRFWSGHNVWYMNVAISNATGRGGLMAPIASGSWLPPLPSGQPLGPRPRSSSDRYHQLYKVFGNAWRVTETTSLFHYHDGTSTADFTDRDWPGENQPCNATPGPGVPGLTPLPGMELAQAEQICSFLTDDGLRQDCVFDVAVTGDESFAAGYRFAEALNRKSIGITVTSTEEDRDGRSVTVLTALVRLLSGGVPAGGAVSFWEGDTKLSPDIPLHSDGRASWTAEGDVSGPTDVTAHYDGGEDAEAATSSPSRVDVTPAPPETTTPTGGGNLPWWIWALLLILILLILIILF